MKWSTLKARLIEEGRTRVRGIDDEIFIACSTAGPGAGGPGAIFFSQGNCRVRLTIDPDANIEVVHTGGGEAELHLDGEIIHGRIEKVGLHCPRQAYITVSEGCIYRCRYCPVPAQEARVKTPEEVAKLVEGVLDRIDAISLTSGVVGSPKEDEDRVVLVVERLKKYKKPIGVSIYPLPGTPERLYKLGVEEVKFNIETATGDLFGRMCPGLSWQGLWDALEESVSLFGKNHVFSNIILGVGESNEEMMACIDRLCSMGVIPVVRPLTPAAELKEFTRPSAGRILAICRYQGKALEKAGLEPWKARTMCVACTGCDCAPWRDL